MMTDVYAGWGTRTIAYTIDLVVCSLFLLPAYVIAVFQGFGDDPLRILILWAPAVWLYFSFFDSELQPGTPGKQVMEIIVTDYLGKPLPLGRALARAPLKILFGMPTILSLLNVMLIARTTRQQGVQDLVVATLAVRRKASAFADDTDTGGPAAVSASTSSPLTVNLLIILAALGSVVILSALIAAFFMSLPSA
ncbi:MAG: RDD family protein [Methanomicrobiales archaeon]|nr:RDD family protein [Methanomicrobiales archaeon]